MSPTRLAALHMPYDASDSAPLFVWQNESGIFFTGTATCKGQISAFEPWKSHHSHQKIVKVRLKGPDGCETLCTLQHSIPPLLCFVSCTFFYMSKWIWKFDRIRFEEKDTDIGIISVY